MPAYSDNGLALRWDEDEPAARIGLGGFRRVAVWAAPPHPSNVVHGVYQVDGGPERTARGFPLAQPSGVGEQPFVIDFPPLRDAARLTWRPVLSRAGRRLDPRQGGAPDSVLKSVPVEAPAALPVEPHAPARFPYQLDFLARVTVPLEQPPIMVGNTPDGLRIVFPLGEGGTVRGPKINGTVEHVGGDWMRVREDGIGVTAIRAIIKTDDGATLQSEYSGFVDFGADGQAELAAGRGPQRAPLNLTPQYLTEHPRWQWLNRLQCVGFGVVTMRTLLVEYDLYAMRSEAAGEVR
jgi:hypothetical protein